MAILGIDRLGLAFRCPLEVTHAWLYALDPESIGECRTTSSSDFSGGALGGLVYLVLVGVGVADIGSSCGIGTKAIVWLAEDGRGNQRIVCRQVRENSHAQLCGRGYRGCHIGWL